MIGQNSYSYPMILQILIYEVKLPFSPSHALDTEMMLKNAPKSTDASNWKHVTRIFVRTFKVSLGS